eukprot:1549547-Lingulodinium_polyedra.AAC.1
MVGTQYVFQLAARTASADGRTVRSLDLSAVVVAGLRHVPSATASRLARSHLTPCAIASLAAMDNHAP